MNLQMNGGREAMAHSKTDLLIFNPAMFRHEVLKLHDGTSSWTFYVKHGEDNSLEMNIGTVSEISLGDGTPSVFAALPYRAGNDTYMKKCSFSHFADAEDYLKRQLLPTPKPIWTVIYTHKHGLDVTALSTEELAYKYALELVSIYRDDFDVDEDLTDEDAYGEWYTHTWGQEHIEITMTNVLDKLEEDDGTDISGHVQGNTIDGVPKEG